MLGELLAIDVEQPHAHGLVLGGLAASPNARRTSALAAVRNLAAHLLVRQRRELLLGAQRVQRFHHVLRGVEQRAVEVEQHALIGAFDRGASVGGVARVRCMR